MSNPRRYLLAVGTYTLRMPHVDGKGSGIHLLAFDPATAQLSEVLCLGGVTNPSYLTADAQLGRLYSVREVGADDGPGIEVFDLDADNVSLMPRASFDTPGGWPCHVSLDKAGHRLLVSNYMTGEVLVFALDPDGDIQGEPQVLQRNGHGPRADRQDGPHAHCAQVSPDGKALYLADLGVDALVRHPIRDGQVASEPDLRLPALPGAGPRHLAFSPCGRYLLLNHELSSSLALLRVDGERVQRLAEVSCLPNGWVGESGAGGMRVHPSGRFVYVANRGHDSLFAARLDTANGTLLPIGTWPSGGRTPRDFAITPDGRHLLCASQDDGVIRVFDIDLQSGELSQAGPDYPIATAVCLQFI